MSIFMIESLEPRALLAATSWHIDVGGGGFTESNGRTWIADGGFVGGTVSATGKEDIRGTELDELMRSRRYNEFRYSLPVENGTYRVRLLMMDPAYSSAGRRVFDVLAENQLKLDNFQIAVAAGGDNIAISRSFETSVSDGRLNLDFRNVVEYAIVSAIEVLPISVTPAPSWVKIDNAPQAKFESTAEAVGDKLYVFGGYFNAQTKSTGQVAVYDPATGNWSTKKNMPENLTHAGTAVDGRFIWFAGGYIGDWLGDVTPVTNHVWRYDTASDSWARMINLPAARSAGALVKAGNALHFFGGLDSAKKDKGDHWALDLRSPTRWFTRPALPDPRNHLGGIGLGSKLYAIGGQHDLDEDNGNETAVHAFDLTNNTWSAVASLPKKLSHTHNSTVTLNGKIVSVGGSTTNSTSVRDVYQYDPATNKWTTLAQYPVAISAAAAGVIDGQIYATGGTSGSSQPRLDTWVLEN